MTFEEVKKDYLEIFREYSEPYDMTGGFVDADYMIKVILNPTKRNAKMYLISVIQYGFQWGSYWKNAEGDKISIDDSEIVNRLYNKYIIN